MRRFLARSLGVLWLVCLGAVASPQSLPGGPARGDGIRGAEIVDVNAVNPETFRAVANRLAAAETVTIDGRLDDEAWARAERHGRFIQREPQLGHPASEPTEFSVLYDDRCIYFGIWAFDSDYRGIAASELKRDASLKKGDQVKIIIDSFRDRQNGYFFSTNPLGAFKDAQHIDNGRTINMDWNAVWEVKTSVDDGGWYAEIKIPFSQLRFKGGSVDEVWGLNVSRVVIRKNEDSYWVPFPREWGTPGFSRVSSAGLLTGLRDLSARRRFEAVPYVSPAVVQNAAAGLPAASDARVGFDLRVGVTSALTADVTYHTDFAQVEADEETINLSRFNLMFAEKRQFFSEPAGLFGYGAAAEREHGASPTGPQEPGLLPLFYSRRIGQVGGSDVPIRFGARVTGRTGAYQVGVMEVQTDGPDPTMVNASSVGVRNFVVGRIKRDVLGRSSVGAIVLSRDGGGATPYNRAVGVDINLVLGKRVTLTGLAAKTFTPGVRGKDIAGAFDFLAKTDRWITAASYSDIPERFNAEMGFIRRTDIRSAKAKAGWTPRPGWRGVRQLAFTGTGEVFQDHGGRVISDKGTGDFLATFIDSSSLQVTFLRDFDRLKAPWKLGPATLLPGGYQWDTTRATFASNQSKRVAGSVSFETGGYYGGDKRTYKVAANLNPLGTLLIETSLQRNRVEFAAAQAYRTTTLSNRISYSFSPNLFVKSFVQYNSDRKLATANLLLWYTYRPGSDLYVVYNQGWDTDLPDGAFASTRNRSLTVKLTWWLSR
jgi:hypothetical protein